MASTDISIPVDMFFLVADVGTTLQQQICSQVIAAVRSRKFRPRDRMPSSRELARHLGISRVTVSAAYTDLVAGDFLTSRDRSGYFISGHALDAPFVASPVTGSAKGVDWSRFSSEQRIAEERRASWREDWRAYPFPFVYGQVDPALFDHGAWRQCAVQALGRRDFAEMTGDHYDCDDPELIEYISQQVLPRRGIEVGPDEILLTMGAQNALWLATELLTGHGSRRVAVENPCYPELRRILARTGVEVHPVDVDDGGLPPEHIPSGCDVVFCTPSHQCPTNTTMSLERRRRLIERAQNEGFVIIEDDYEFEMSFGAPPTPALRALDREASVVVHIGSFSKSMFPGLRLGYLVAHPTFIKAARALRSVVLRHPPGLIQRTLSHFLSQGHYDAQIARTRNAFALRRKTLADAIETEGLTVAHSASAGGSSFWMCAPAGLDSRRLAGSLQRRGVLIEPGGPFFDHRRPDNTHYRLAYSSISEKSIPEGVHLISAAIRSIEAGTQMRATAAYAGRSKGKGSGLIHIPPEIPKPSATDISRV